MNKQNVFLKKLNIETPVGLSHSTLGCMPQRWKTYIHTGISTCVLTAALFLIVKRWKQPQCPSHHEQKTNCGIAIQWTINWL